MRLGKYRAYNLKKIEHKLICISEMFINLINTQVWILYLTTQLIMNQQNKNIYFDEVFTRDSLT